MRVKRINNDNIVKKINDIRTEENRKRGRIKKKWKEIIGEDIRAYGKVENIVVTERGKIRVAAWEKLENK